VSEKNVTEIIDENRIRELENTSRRTGGERLLDHHWVAKLFSFSDLPEGLQLYR